MQERSRDRSEPRQPGEGYAGTGDEEYSVRRFLISNKAAREAAQRILDVISGVTTEDFERYLMPTRIGVLAVDERSQLTLVRDRGGVGHFHIVREDGTEFQLELDPRAVVDPDAIWEFEAPVDLMVRALEPSKIGGAHGNTPQGQLIIRSNPFTRDPAPPVLHSVSPSALRKLLGQNEDVIGQIDFASLAGPLSLTARANIEFYGPAHNKMRLATVQFAEDHDPFDEAWRRDWMSTEVTDLHEFSTIGLATRAMSQYGPGVDQRILSTGFRNSPSDGFVI